MYFIPFLLIHTLSVSTYSTHTRMYVYNIFTIHIHTHALVHTYTYHLQSTLTLILLPQVDKEHRAALHFQQAAEEAKTPLVVAQAEIESLKKELQAAHRHELQLAKETDKVS